ncbi:hypothetical protein D9613_004187 [Agrocybe pediades]|uniref:F-box domain-containing protein n=1 Tax=Agrocybe pediades TaxID=84607 RepID=A0A8H4VJG5_9AGAR|nr:hypothetical protein D9613_004187 [Agrocybe pediades]
MRPPDNGGTSPFRSVSSLQQPPAVALPKSMASHDDPLTSEDQDGRLVVGKGKQRSMPVPIRASTIMHDLFDMSPPSSASTGRPSESSPSSSSAFSPSSSNFSSTDFDNRYLRHNMSVDSMEQLEFRCEEGPTPSEGSISGKGKDKAVFPYLPPLTFSVIQLDPTFDLSPTAGSSSYGTLYSPGQNFESLIPSSPSSHGDRGTAVSPTSSSHAILAPEHGSQPQDGTTEPMLPRCRSLSNLSQSISPLLANVLLAHDNPTNVPTTSRAQSNLSRQLQLQEGRHGLSPSERTAAPSSQVTIDHGPSSYPPAWYTVSKPSGHTRAIQSETRPTFKAKARSNSSPYPISALDFIPHTSTDIFQPLSIITPNYFDLILPKELRLHILRALIELHEQDYQRSIREGRLTSLKAASSKGRWVGRDKGVRELFKLSRVSKGWRALVFDGELWIDMDLRSFHFLPTTVLTRLFEATGSFVRKLNFAGHDEFDADTLSMITDALCITVPEVPLSYTQITSANFQGCISLTTRSLHHFLVRSKSLQHLSVKGLSAVTNTTCDILANFCPKLLSLNMSRCPNLDGHGVGALTVSAIFRKEHLPLKELRLSCLRHVSDSVMQALGRAAPFLEVLDLSYARPLHNSAIEAYVACEGFTDHQLALETTIVSQRDLGRESNENGKLKRRVTRLRHLNLSYCLLLSDTACANLAHSVPNLEFLELAGIGADMKDPGIVRLLATTPNIRRLDLEDAFSITDAVLTAITPLVQPPSTSTAAAPPPKQPGHALQHLIVSHAGQITDSAFLTLIRNCPRLTVLEADDTRIGAASFKEFVRLSRERKLINAKIVAVDCRGVHEGVVKELTPITRPRLGWRAYGARKLGYLDARDDNEDDLKIGQDECDENRVVVKTFYSWQTVDAVKAAREKRRKASGRRVPSDSSNSSWDSGNQGTMVPGSSRHASGRWWSPSGRTRTQRTSSPLLPDLNNEGCRTM